MKIAIASDEACELTQALIAEVSSYSHEIILFGALHPDDQAKDWSLCGGDVGEYVAQGHADQGIVCCWTGTGASIVANKVPGIRAALVGDGETARGARIWNHANVLALSIRSTSIPLMKEIVREWFATSTTDPDAQTEWNLRQLQNLRNLEVKYARDPS